MSFGCCLASSFSVLVLCSASWSFRVHMYNFVFSQNLKGIFWELFVCIAPLCLVFFNSLELQTLSLQVQRDVGYPSLYLILESTLLLRQGLQSCITCCSKSENSYFVCFVQFSNSWWQRGKSGTNYSFLFDLLAEFSCIIFSLSTMSNLSVDGWADPVSGIDSMNVIKGQKDHCWEGWQENSWSKSNSSQSMVWGSFQRVHRSFLLPSKYPCEADFFLHIHEPK